MARGENISMNDGHLFTDGPTHDMATCIFLPIEENLWFCST